MLNPELWIQGGTTLAVGMGIVFSFLVILVFAIMIMANAVAWLNKVCPVAIADAKTSKKVAKSDDSEIALAVAMAVARG